MGHPLGERRRSGGGEQVSVRMQPLARRKVQSAHRLAKFLPRDDVADSHAAQMRLVEQGEASREKLAIDDALAEPRDDAETDASRQLGQRLADAAPLVRVDVMATVAPAETVDRPPVALDRDSAV